jgi:hypothetical protein
MGFPHLVFPGTEGALAAALGEVDLSALWEVFEPRLLELGSRYFKGLRGTFNMVTMMRSWIEAAVPAPLVDVGRNPGAFGDCPNVNVSIIDLPAIGDVTASAAGEFHSGILAGRKIRYWPN